jgi:G3E family GTPase
MADRIVLSKTDVATKDEAEATRALLQSLAPTAALAAADDVRIEALLAPAPLAPRNLEALPQPHGAVGAIALASEAPLTRQNYDLFIELLRSAHAPNLLRLKGLVRIAEEPERPLVVQGVRHVFAEPRFLESWPDDDRRTRLVAIGENLAPDLLARLYAAFAGTIAPDRPDRAAVLDNPLAPRSGGLLG